MEGRLKSVLGPGEARGGFLLKAAFDLKGKEKTHYNSGALEVENLDLRF